MEDEKQMEMSEEVKKKIMDIAKRLYDLQEESKNSNSDSDDSEHIVERLKQMSLNLLKVRTQSSFVRCLFVWPYLKYLFPLLSVLNNCLDELAHIIERLNQTSLNLLKVQT